MIIATHEMGFARDFADEVVLPARRPRARARPGRAGPQCAGAAGDAALPAPAARGSIGRRSELRSSAHASSRWRAKRPSSSISAAAPHRMSALERRVLAGEAAGEVDRRDVLVHRVGDDVLVVERGRVAVEAEPAQAVGVAPVGDRRRHLEQRQVADDRPAQPPVKPEHRHEVDGCERDGREVVDVGAVARVEPERVHRAGEQRRVDAVGVAAAVLVGLDLDHRRLRAAGQARQRPRVRVGLLELVRRAVDDELQVLLERAVALEVARQRRARRRRPRSPAARRPSGRRRSPAPARRGAAPASNRRSSSPRSASSDGSHSQRSSTPGSPR